MYIHYTDPTQTPLPGKMADFKTVALVPLEKHRYFMEQDEFSGYWVYGCYTCNRYFCKPQEHQEYFNKMTRQYRSYEGSKSA